MNNILKKVVRSEKYQITHVAIKKWFYNYMTESKIRAKKTKSGTACIALRQLATIAGTLMMTLIRTTNRAYEISSNHNRISRIMWTFDMFDPLHET